VIDDVYYPIGYVDEVAVYNYALSAGRIEAHYSSAVTSSSPDGVIPEPAALSLLGLAALAMKRKRA